MKVVSIQSRFCRLTLMAFFLAAPALQAQSSAAHVDAAPDEQHVRSRIFIYDLRDGSSRLIYSADSMASGVGTCEMYWLSADSTERQGGRRPACM